MRTVIILLVAGLAGAVLPGWVGVTAVGPKIMIGALIGGVVGGVLMPLSQRPTPPEQGE